MSRNVLTVVAAAAVALFAQGAFAQASSPSRADVKAETKAAEKNKQLTPAGEGAGAMSSGNTGTSTTSKAAVKADTKSAAKSHQLTAAGEGPGNMGTGASAGSSTTKEARKADTKAAAKNKQLTPAGEGSEAPKK